MLKLRDIAENAEKFTVLVGCWELDSRMKHLKIKEMKNEYLYGI